MKNIQKAVLLAVTFLALALPVAAQAADPVSVAVVDVQLLMTQSKAGKNIQEQLENRKTKFLAQISDEEKKLRDDEKALADQRASLSADTFQTKAKAFEEKVTKTRGQAQDRKKALEDGANDALEKLRNEIMKVVQGIATDKGYSLVLSRQSVVVSSKDYDITSDVLAKLDADISQIPLTVKE